MVTRLLEQDGGEATRGCELLWWTRGCLRGGSQDSMPDERLGLWLTVSRFLSAERLSVYSPGSGAGRATAALDMTMQHFQRLAEQVSRLDNL